MNTKWENKVLVDLPYKKKFVGLKKMIPDGK